MKRTLYAMGGILLALFLSGSFAWAGETPYTSAAMEKKLRVFRQKVGAVFILPQSLGPHPGASYVLSRARELGLSEAQIRRIRAIRRRMVTRSLRQFERIDTLRARYLAMMDHRNPPLDRARKLYMQLTRLMAKATFDHLEGHIAVGRVLTGEQWRRLHGQP